MTQARKLHIAHLFPDLLNLYADRGNVRSLVQRLRWRGIDSEIHAITHRDVPRFTAYDLVLLGGGSDREQEIVANHLAGLKLELKKAISAGLPLLGICGGYQLLGEYYQLPDGQKISGLGVLDMYTNATADAPRLIGNIAISSPYGVIMGFENHGGRTVHHHAPLGTVLQGHGNDGQSGFEGVHHQNVWGTYIHGPLLPKNPTFADAVLQAALRYSGQSDELAPLEDEAEQNARTAFLNRRLQNVDPSVLQHVPDAL